MMKRNRLYAMMWHPRLMLLMLVIICMGFDASAQGGAKEPQADEYFDLIGERDENDVLHFKSGSNEEGFLRSPNDYRGYNDQRYYIFTNKRWIRVSDAHPEGNSKISSVEPFDSLVISGKYQRGGANSLLINTKKPRGYIKAKEGVLQLKDETTKEMISFFVVKLEDWEWPTTKLSITKIGNKKPIEVNLGDEKSITCDSLFISGDSILLEVKRQRRGVVKSLTLGSEPLRGKYDLLHDNTLREKDDIAHATATLKTDTVGLFSGRDTATISIKMEFEFIKDGKLQSEERIVEIKVAPQKNAAGTKWYVVIIPIVVIGLLAIWAIIRFHSKKPKQTESKNVALRDEEMCTDLTLGSATPKAQEEPSPDVFACISNEKAANILLGYLKKVCKGDIQKMSIDDLNKKIDKSWVRQFCSEWNEKKETVFRIDTSQYNKDSLFNLIEKGYIGEAAKNILIEFRDKELKGENDFEIVFETYIQAVLTKGQNEGCSAKFPEASNQMGALDDSVIQEKNRTIERLERELADIEKERNKGKEDYDNEQKRTAEIIAEWEAKEKEVCEKLKKLLAVLKEQHFEVEEKEAQSAVEATQLITIAVSGGVKDNERQAEINKLQLALNAEKKRMEEEKEQAQNNLKKQKDEYKKEINQIKEKHKEELKDKKEEYKKKIDTQKEKLIGEHQDKLSAINEKYQKEVAQLNQDHQTKIDSLNKDHAGVVADKEGQIHQLGVEIRHQKDEIEKLGEEAHADCTYYIDRLVLQMNHVQELINSLNETTCAISGNSSPYANVIRNVEESYKKFCEQVNQSNTPEQWGNNAVKLPQVREKLQGYIAAGLRSTGWVNIVNYLNLYAGATAELNDTFNANGLSTATLSQLYGDTQKLIGMFGVKVVVPHLLVEKFDDQYFDFANADQWIRTFYADLHPRDYKSKVFDMSCIGYQIEDNEYNKPKVFYY